MTTTVSLGEAGKELGVSGGDLWRAGVRRVSREQLDELAEAWLRAWKDQGDTDIWASSVLHRASVHEIDLGDGRVVPVLPPALKALR
jgi:hypothetical protein